MTLALFILVEQKRVNRLSFEVQTATPPAKPKLKKSDKLFCDIRWTATKQ